MQDKTWTKEDIRHNLEKNDRWVYNAVVAIYNLQTEDEKMVEDTTDHNGIGFNGVDAGILSSFACQIMKWKERANYTRPLSKKQLVLARKRILKYSGQLTRIANGEL